MTTWTETDARLLWALVGTLGLLLGGCGTEIGNGHHDETNSNGKKTTGTPSVKPDSAAPSPVPESTPAAGMEQPSAGAPSSISPIPNDLIPLLNSCASPFSQPLGIRIQLRKEDITAPMNVVFDWLGTEWTLTTNEKVIANIKPVSTIIQTVQVFDGLKAPLDYGYTCSTILKTSDVLLPGGVEKVIRFEVTLTQNGQSSKLRWYGLTSAASGDMYLLRRVEIENLLTPSTVVWTVID